MSEMKRTTLHEMYMNRMRCESVVDCVKEQVIPVTVKVQSVRWKCEWKNVWPLALYLTGCAWIRMLRLGVEYISSRIANKLYYARVCST